MVATAERRLLLTRRWDEPENWFHNKATDYVVAQILFHLNQVGVFNSLSVRNEWTRSEHLADELGLEDRILNVLLTYLAGVDDVIEENRTGEFKLSAFGERVVKRYGKETSEGLHVNMFDVRVGAYGPVWGALDSLVKGEQQYGKDIHRAGTYAERGLYATARGMGPSLLDALSPSCGTVVELGVETGLLEYVGKARPDISLFGLDRDARALSKCTELAAKEGVSGITSIEADLFDVQSWANALKGRSAGVIYTIHMHEFMAAGRARIVELVVLMKKQLPGWKLVFFEQPKPYSGDRGEVKESIWLAAQSNILIHHLIKNGKILDRNTWQTLIVEAGGTVQDVIPSEYLNYDRYRVQL